MSTRSREVIFGSRIRGARIRAEGAREEAIRAVREADRAEAEAWSIRMEGYGGPAQPSPTIAQCLNGGYGWLQVKCHRGETEASISLNPSAGRGIGRQHGGRAGRSDTHHLFTTARRDTVTVTRSLTACFVPDCSRRGGYRLARVSPIRVTTLSHWRFSAAG